MRHRLNYLLLSLLVLSLSACGGSSSDEGNQARERAGQGTAESPTAAEIGPVERVELGTIDRALAKKGEELFDSRCKTCHRFGERYIGPDLTNTASQRDPVYIMNMILAPEDMLQKHHISKELLAEYGTMMTNQNLSRDQARAILEYLRTIDEGAGASSSSQ